MKCTFKHIHSVETRENTVGTRIDGFIYLQTTWLPWSIHKWIMEYEGLNATIYPMVFAFILGQKLLVVKATLTI